MTNQDKLDPLIVQINNFRNDLFSLLFKLMRIYIYDIFFHLFLEKLINLITF